MISEEKKREWYKAQLASGYESDSGFRDAFSRIMEAPPSKCKEGRLLLAALLDTPLGPMLAIGDDEALYLLEFVLRRGLEREIERMRKRAAILPGRSAAIERIEEELRLYFEGRLQQFKTPYAAIGSPFQKRVWEELQKIPYGQTRSYRNIAVAIGRPSAFRAVAQANGANQLALVIPCHRVINSDGTIGGYGGGVSRKERLLEWEIVNVFGVIEKGL